MKGGERMPDGEGTGEGTRRLLRGGGVPYAAVRILVVLATVLIASAIGYSTYIADRNIRVTTPQVNAAHEIGIEIALAHVLIEEAMQGDPNVGERDIWEFFETSDRLAEALLEGGSVHGIDLLPVADEPVREAVRSLRKEIARSIDITAERLTHPAAGMVGGLLDEQFDEIFGDLLGHARIVEGRLNEAILRRAGTFRAVQVSLGTLALLFSALFLFTIVRAGREQREHIAELTSMNMQLQATEQQLRASNQQLMASEEELQASNQQMMANEAAMRDSEERFDSLFIGMAEGVALHTVVYDDSGRAVNYRINEVNRRYEEILGISRQQVEGRLATEIYSTPEPPYLEEFTSVARTGKAFQFTTYFPPMEKHFAISVAPFGPGMFATIFSDITEHRRTEDAVRQNEARLQAVVEVTEHEAGTLQEFLDQTLERAIRLTQSTIGYLYFYSERKKEFTLNSWSRDVMKECRIQKPQTCYFLDKTGIWGEAVRQRKPIVLNDFAAENPLKKGYPDGHVPLTRFLTVPVIRQGAIVAVIGVANKGNDYGEADIRQLTLFADAIWSIVERKQAEEAKFALEAQMEKLESLGVLAGGIAHDFNNLLAAILGNVSLARGRAGTDSKQALWLSEAEKACQRAKDLTTQLLTFSRGGAPVKRAASIQEIIRDVAGFVLRGTGVAVDIAAPPDIWPVEVDTGQISQVFQNLLINAVQAMRDGGVIRVAAANRTISEEDGGPLAAGKYVDISVQDEGEGISPERLSRIFDPYFTTKEQGSGLGLAVSFSIVKRHNGLITVRSEIGSGSIFTVTLPATGKHPEAPAKSTTVSLSGGGRVLVMDDEQSVLDVVREMLQAIGYTVECTNTGDRALALYAASLQDGKRFDAVIVDLTIPGGMGGKELIGRLLALDRNATVIVSSGYSQDPVMADHRSYGFKGVLMKPYTVPALTEVLHQALASS